MRSRIGRDGLWVALAGLGVLGCDNSMSSVDAGSPRQPSLAVTAFAVTGMRGTGGMGPGIPTTFGIERQWFDFDVSGTPPAGRLDYIDSAFVKSDGHHPHLVVGAQYPGTAITSFAPTSEKCAQFTGVGYLINTGESLAFVIDACDNAQPGVAFDTFGITVPQRILDVGTFYQAGPFPLVYGELTAAGTPVTVPGIP
jgi:hypothetical protein